MTDIHYSREHFNAKTNWNPSVAAVESLIENLQFEPLEEDINQIVGRIIDLEILGVTSQRGLWNQLDKKLDSFGVYDAEQICFMVGVSWRTEVLRHAKYTRETSEGTFVADQYNRIIL